MAATVKRSAVVGTVIGIFVCTLSACGSGRERPVRTGAVARASYPERSYEVLSLSALGKFEGSCPRGARSWTLRFVADDAANETVSYRIGGGRHHTSDVNPGKSIAFHLIANTARTHEPRLVPPRGQPRGLTTAVSVPTTKPLSVQIYQATEPQTLRANVRLALRTIGGESGQCVLVGSTISAYTYPNSRP